MTASTENYQKCCSAACSYVSDIDDSDGLFECFNSDSDHYSHVFTDSHPICDDCHHNDDE